MVRIPLAKYGLRELAIGTALCAGVGLACFLLLTGFPLLLWPAVAVVAALWVFLLSFFRDPERPCPGSERHVLSPADGTVAEVSEVDDPPYLEEPAVKVGIFMSIFNCHVNRAPVSATVRYVKSRDGAYHDARKPESATENAQVEVGLETANGGRVVVRLIVGAVARRIVCAVEEGDWLERGQRLGMIKFGSRVEVYLPRSRVKEVRVERGTKIKAGLDVVAELQNPQEGENEASGR